MEILNLEKIEGDSKRVEDMLFLLDEFYIPTISSIVSIPHYAKKLLEKAHVYIPKVGNQDCGVLAFYMNDNISKTAFISSIGLLPAYQGKGLALLMLEFFESTCKKNYFNQLQLEVHQSNTKAIKFYKKFGFVPVEDRGLFILMKKEINCDG
ncbi:Acetyltransferases [Aquiflexum balticum DSM 16537]|uniref:Acetyltransferases n=1 Tax=Aquiflexum balticum DSM 16537 TaxID=758820 RepID=A0A1W2HAY4_9BACT|nr:GNAT family N-acetyltransferase [Aquiflexum balticum]SMD46059.1 Acetyltransferases [Aquiflexum balticum DSM 16537]